MRNPKADGARCKQTEDTTDTEAALSADTAEGCAVKPADGRHATGTPSTQLADAGLHEKCATGVQSSELAELADLWPRLPDAVKAGLLATARAVAGAPKA